METLEIIRKIQHRQGSFVITIPKKMVNMLDIKPNQYAKIVVMGNKLVISTVPVNDSIQTNSEYDLTHTDDTKSTQEHEYGSGDASTGNEQASESDLRLDGLRM